ncbi:glycoside hydrolase 43 family protein [Flavobacterium sp. AS60]|uniref:glycoside hydrolase family 43 protein n=1 Tax=Flavobacterium anseongense TaxID=2910677 RepID=UPI001F380772|nr:glycoside hydrolase 43 family protein [Flavobacterium sp. AS60]MCF6130099.1 glycoside hydrolase 43 family protein [Flavobacterium sp. AS60]
MNSIYFLCFFFTSFLFGQERGDSFSKSIWVSDKGDGTYTNPILNTDYSDPDVIRVGDKFYMTASSFNCIPGLPILESNDLVNWKLINYGLKKQKPVSFYNKAQHGKGVWAPCIRYHNKEFYIYYPDPDYGIYMIKSKKAEGQWSEPILVKKGKGLIDPTPLWDDDGNTYLVYAFAGSRAGIKSILVGCTMNAEGTMTNNDEVLLFDGHQDEPTLEGPKIYKRNGYYYIFAPAGGVATGWQTVFRAKNIYGPYENKKVLEQGTSNVNGPHQGAWIQTKSGEDWFIHFQDKGIIGRVVHLQPMKWVNDWPVIGIDTNGDGIGEPVLNHKKPNVGKSYPVVYQKESDEFNKPILDLQWQWHANPQINWGFPSSYGYYMLNCIPKPKKAVNLFDVPNLLLQKFPSEEFTATTKLIVNFNFDEEEAGLLVMGLDYCMLRIKQTENKLYLSQMICLNADKNQAESEAASVLLKSNIVYLQIKSLGDGMCTFFYSEDGTDFKSIGIPFKAREGKWIGAKLGFVALRNGFINNAGNCKLDWIRFNS